MSKAQKLVQLLDLVRRDGGVRVVELQQRFELDERSLRRYLADLRELEVPLVDEGRGEARTLSVERWWRRTGVQLTLMEVLSLHFGRKLFTFLEGTSFQTEMDGAIERLEPAINRTNKDLAARLDAKFLAVPEHAKDYSGEASEVVEDLVTALLYDTPIDVSYTKPSGLRRLYRLHPYTLAVYRQGLYVFALDVEAGQVKTFAVERIADIARDRRERFTVPPDWNPSRYLEHAFGIMSGEPRTVRVAFSPEVRAYVRERRWHASQRLDPRPDGWAELVMRVAVTPELVAWVRSFGPDARVLDPPELVAEIREGLARALASYPEPR
jgi:proteasome accessory factor B